MTEQEADNFSNNIWIFRVHRGLDRAAIYKGIMEFSRYRRIEYGDVVPTREEAEQIATRLETHYDALIQPPNYNVLLSRHRIRKVIDLYSTLHTARQRNMIISLLRELTHR